MNIGIRLQRLRNEDFIWILYLFISIFAIISDSFERKFVVNKDLKSQKIFKTINITIFITALFIYAYFVLINYQDIESLKKDVSKKEGLNRHLSLISSLLFLIGGALALYIELNSGSPDFELAE